MSDMVKAVRTEYSMYGEKMYSEAVIEGELQEALEAKRSLASKMGYDGRIIREIEIEGDSELLERELRVFRNGLGIRFKAATSSFTTEEWFSNRLSEDKFISFCGIELRKGMRVSKSLARIGKAKEFDFTDDKIGEIQTKYSRVLNEKVSKGALIISVNPIDFLGMSNGQGWSSCIAPSKEYGSGTLSYAKDKYSIVSFLISSKHLESFLKGPNEALKTPRKWRKLFFIESQGHKAILGSKGYPFDGEQLSIETATTIGKEVMGGMSIDEWHNYELVRKGMSIRKAERGAQAYSDITAANTITFFCNAKQYQENRDRGVLESTFYRFRFGNALKCLSCGKNNAGEDAGVGDCCMGERCYLCEDPVYDEGELFGDPDPVGEICQPCADCNEDIAYCVLQNLYGDVGDMVFVKELGGPAFVESIEEAGGFVCDECDEGFIAERSKDGHCEDCFHKITVR